MKRLFCSLILSSTQVAWAGENAAPSSHFVFDDNFEGDIIINEVRVPKGGEALYTYYETMGWRGKAAGYCGIQAHPKAHNFIFSIWDHKSDTAPIKAVHRGPGTKTEKFGGEGTGLKSWNFELGWQTDTWYSLVSRCWPVGEHMFYGFWSRSGATEEWTHLVTMDVAVKDAYFNGGTDSFIEDWLETGKNKRVTNLRGGWKRRRERSWYPFGGGRYSVNSWDLVKGKRSFHYNTNWNGGVSKDSTGEFYFMTAGGAETKPTSANPSKHGIKRTETEPSYAPLGIKSLRARLAEGNRVMVEWENNPTGLPQFGCEIVVYERPRTGMERVVATESLGAHQRRAKIQLSAKRSEGCHFVVKIRVRDILDRDLQIKEAVVSELEE